MQDRRVNDSREEKLLERERYLRSKLDDIPPSFKRVNRIVWAVGILLMLLFMALVSAHN